MMHRRPNNARAMRAVYGRPSASHAVELGLSWLAAFVVVGVALGITLLAMYVASLR